MAPINVDDGDDGGDSSSADAEQAAAQLAAQQAAALLAAQQAAALLAAQQAAAQLAAAQLAAEQAAALLAAEQAAALRAAEQAAAQRAAQRAAAIAAAIAADSAVVTICFQAGSTVTRYGKTFTVIAYANAVATNPVVPICFLAGTKVTTDQGNIDIEKLNPKIHTIRGKKIVSITKSTPLQKIFYNGKMVNVIDLGEVFQGATENNGKIIYIVLLKSIRR